jgi:hypothetical protein
VGEKGRDTSEGAATKSMEGSDWISLASSRMRRTPGDLVLRGMTLLGGHVKAGVERFIGGEIAVSDGFPFFRLL